jgi:hypothetical protein
MKVVTGVGKGNVNSSDRQAPNQVDFRNESGLKMKAFLCRCAQECLGLCKPKTGVREDEAGNLFIPTLRSK